MQDFYCIFNYLSTKFQLLSPTRSAYFLSRGPKNEMMSLGGPQLLSKGKHSAHFNIVLFYLSKNYDFNRLFLLCKVERVCNETRQDLSLTI